MTILFHKTKIQSIKFIHLKVNKEPGHVANRITVERQSIDKNIFLDSVAKAQTAFTKAKIEMHTTPISCSLSSTVDSSTTWTSNGSFQSTSGSETEVDSDHSNGYKRPKRSKRPRKLSLPGKRLMSRNNNNPERSDENGVNANVSSNGVIEIIDLTDDSDENASDDSLVSCCSM